jgi:hypothetical protein
MKDFGAEVRRDAVVSGDPREEAGLFVSRRRGARPAPLVLRDPVLPAGMAPVTAADLRSDAVHDSPPDDPSDRAAWIARQLAADCFHFARPGLGRR